MNVYSYSYIPPYVCSSSGCLPSSDLSYTKCVMCGTRLNSATLKIRSNQRKAIKKKNKNKPKYSEEKCDLNGGHLIDVKSLDFRCMICKTNLEND